MNLLSEKNRLEMTGGSPNFEEKMKNITIYGKIGEIGSIIMSSDELKIFDQIESEYNKQAQIIKNIKLMDYEHIELLDSKYSLNLEYLIENCSKWQVFANKSFENPPEKYFYLFIYYMMNSIIEIIKSSRNVYLILLN